MTPNDRDTHNGQAPASADKVLDHTRLQLSALIDGELPLDEARFLLRRLEHDIELRDCWDRWQLCGDVLRGRVGVQAREDLAVRIAGAVAAEPMVSRDPAASHRWLRWGSGAALAASVAMIALFLTRQSPDVRVTAARSPAQVASAPVPTPVQRPVDPAAAPVAPRRAAEDAAVLAVADVPRRLATRRSRGQSQRAALRSPARIAIETPAAVAAATPFSTPATATVDPFSGQHVRLPNRPWPRALLPSASANGAFTVDYGSRIEIGPRPLSPFSPRSQSLPVAPPPTESDPPLP